MVRVLDDIATVHSFQENHGGWVDDMALVHFRILVLHNICGNELPIHCTV